MEGRNRVDLAFDIHELSELSLVGRFTKTGQDFGGRERRRKVDEMMVTIKKTFSF